MMDYRDEYFWAGVACTLAVMYGIALARKVSYRWYAWRLETKVKILEIKTSQIYDPYTHVYREQLRL